MINGKLLVRVQQNLKNKYTRCFKLADLPQIKYSPVEHSVGSGLDDLKHISGQLWYVYLNRNGSKRNVNVNQNNADNNWNESVGFLARQSLYSPPLFGRSLF